MKIAHVTVIDGKVMVQDLKEHLEHVAALCREYMRGIGCPTTGYVAGLLHDAGKAAGSFQDRMTAIRQGKPDPGQRGGHASAGAVILRETAGSRDKPLEKFAVQMMCEAIFSHHAALPDNISPKGEDGYEGRMCCEAAELREIETYLWEEIIPKEELETLLGKAYTEVEALFQRVKGNTADFKEASFFFGLLEKMLLSALVDADWLDSAACGGGMSFNFSDIFQSETNYSEERKQLFGYFLENLENRLRSMSESTKDIHVWRSYISEKCREAGNREGGIYTLSCPTGAGKTLASLRFALTHCEERKKEKIFYVIPYISVIDQNAKSIKTALGKDAADRRAEDNILELHSNAEVDNGKENAKEQGAYVDSAFWTQRMSEPIVLTTMVRFLNTFFAKGTRNLRPAHQFQNAVLIFDEIQSLSVRQIGVFNGLINFLAYVCGCTCILCTATQPLLGETKKPVYPAKISEPSALVNLPQEAKVAFRRVVVRAKRKNGGYTGEELAEFVWSEAVANGNALVIMNTKQSALTVYREIEKKTTDEFRVWYLSTRLYAAHRKEVIEQIREALQKEEKIIVVSTQLIEAGIDFDFACVIRSMAGMDSIVQAAGRCNREGLRKIGVTYIVNPSEKLESLAHLKDIREGARQTERLLEEFEANPEVFDGDLLSPKAMYKYFQYYFWVRKEEMTYQIEIDKMRHSLYNLLSDNKNLVSFGVQYSQYEPKMLNQSFKTAAEHFSVIEDIGNPVFVRRGRGREIWEKIQRTTEYKEINKMLKEAQQFVVNVPPYELKKLGESKGVLAWEDKMGMYVLNEMYYDEKTGLSEETGDTMPYYGF
ncbi:MAG: CRISPR-associated helicase Cas3' [Lachnospiraceae bacterium]|nr:CRISPR-associated helicase Cas3' [Lachnospiraceae bacterium]